jgi:hypothetical protein
VLDRFFAVLTITSSFLVRFRPVKCRIEALITFFRIVQERSVRFSFRSGQWSGQTLVKLGQPWSNLVEFGRIWSKLSKLLEMDLGPHFEGSRARWILVGLETARSNPSQTSVNPGQTWSTLVKLSQTWSNLGKCVPDLLLGSI